MAVSDAPITTYSDTTAQKRAISDLISLIDPYDTPFVSYFGLEGDAGAFRIVNWPSTKYEWLEDDLAALASALSGSITSNATTITVDDASFFKPGHVLLVDAEYMWVSSANTSTNVLTVTRNFGGTQATHADAATVAIVSMARAEGAETHDDYKTDITAPYNYTSIFHKGVKITRSARIVSQYGIADEWDYQIGKAIPELMRLVERSVFYGQRKSGSASAARSFGGLKTFITDNTSSLSGAALSRKDIEDVVQSCFEDGGQPDLIVCGPWVKRKISGFYESTVRTERSEDRGGVIINYIETEFGVLQVLMDRWCPATELFVLDSEHIGFLPYDPFFTEELAKTGDYIRGQVVGEYGFVVRHDKAHGYITSISTSS